MKKHDILLVRQRHEADRAGLHFDYRIVIGDKAFSWATKKDLPSPGKIIILHEQPVHDAKYALSKHIVIPKGQYGAGVTTLDFAKKGTAETDNGKYVLSLNDGSRFLIKHMPNYGEKQWLFFNISGMGQTKKAAEGELEGEPTQKHQNRVLEKLKADHPKLIAFHGLGSGKTLTGIHAIKNATKGDKDRALVITPASLTTNFDKEIKKHKVKLDRKKYKVMSYEKALRSKDELGKQNYKMIILDEGQKLRNEESKTVEQLRPLFAKSPGLLLLSGTPVYNHPKDIASLVNTAAGKRVLPEDKKEFEKRFISNKKVNPGIFKRLFLGVKPGNEQHVRNPEHLRKIFQQYVDYYEPTGSAKAFYPKVDEKEYTIPMSSAQEEMYKFMEGKLPGPLKWKIRMGLPPNKQESAQLNSFASGMRQVANTAGPFKKMKSPDESVSPKIETAVSNLVKAHHTDKNFRGIVYSNYLAAGIHPYEAALRKSGIHYGVFTGQQSAREKKKLVKDYNAGKIKVLLLSSAGGEGLDLKGTKLVQILDPHWNESKIKQVIGRGARYKSHIHLPPEEQKVQVEKYISTRKQGPIDRLFKVKSKSIDEYLRDYSKDKEKLKEEIKELMKNKKDGN